MDEKCKFVLNDTNKCICKTANHCGWSFGIRGGLDSSYILFDEVNYMDPYAYDDNDSYNHYTFFQINNSDEDNSYEIYDKDGKYFINCNCYYCTYAKNKHLNNYNECFCCKSHIFMKNIIRCCDCNSIVCINCFVQGRYAEFDDGTFCYDCRKFGICKNMDYYCGAVRYTPEDDWKNASWYY